MRRILLGFLTLLSIILSITLTLSQSPPFQTQKIQMTINFDDIKDWRTLWEIGSGRWEVIEDPTSSWGAKVLTQNETYLDFPKIYLTGAEFYDYDVGVDMKVLPFESETEPENGHTLYEAPPEKISEIAHPRDYSAGILLRYRSAFLFMAIMADVRRGEIVYIRMDLNGPRMVHHVKVPLRLGQWHRLEAKCLADMVSIFWDGAKVFERKERWLTGGRAGLITTRSTRAVFDHFTIQYENISPAPQPLSETPSNSN